MKKLFLNSLGVFVLITAIINKGYSQNDIIDSDPTQLITSGKANQLNYDLTPNMFLYADFYKYVWGVTFSSKLLETAYPVTTLMETRTLKKGYLIYHGYDRIEKKYVAYLINHEIFIDLDRNINTGTSSPIPADKVPFAKNEIIDLETGNTVDPNIVIANMANLKDNLTYKRLKPLYAYGFFHYQQIGDLLSKKPATINISLGATINATPNTNKLSSIMRGCNDKNGTNTDNQLILDRNWPPSYWQ